MDYHQDKLIARLAAQPLPRRLGRLEADVAREIGGSRGFASVPSWRYAAIGMALVAGLGVGGSAGVLRREPLLAADLSGGARLAPSSLLGA